MSPSRVTPAIVDVGGKLLRVFGPIHQSRFPDGGSMVLARMVCLAFVIVVGAPGAPGITRPRPVVDSGNLSGVVRGSSGAPVSGVQVSIETAQQASLASVETNVDGQYEFGDVPTVSTAGEERIRTSFSMPAGLRARWPPRWLSIWRTKRRGDRFREHRRQGLPWRQLGNGRTRSRNHGQLSLSILDFRWKSRAVEREFRLRSVNSATAEREFRDSGM